MSRPEKLYRRLDSLQAELSQRLGARLLACAGGGEQLLFCASAYLPAGWPARLADKDTDTLLGLVEEIHELCVKVGEPFAGSLGWQFREACRRWADVTDAHRGGARRMAEELLAEVEQAGG